jgi:diadenosine tetraphosphate (Ap4A) HIT family hydrolase
MKYKNLLKETRACPFCDTNESRRFITNDSAFLTYALAPYNPDHLLIITKRHFDKILDATPKEISDIDSLEAKTIKILHTLGHKNISIVVRDGIDTGKTVEHIHYHVVPDTRIGDIDHDSNDREILSDEDIKVLSKRIKGAIIKE